MNLLHVLVDLYIHERCKRDIHKKGTYVLVPEQGVVAPGEGLGAPVQVVIGGRLRHLSSILVLDVLNVGSVLNLGVVDPGGADSDWRLVNLNSGQLEAEKTHCQGGKHRSWKRS